MSIYKGYSNNKKSSKLARFLVVLFGIVPMTISCNHNHIVVKVDLNTYCTVSLYDLVDSVDVIQLDEGGLNSWVSGGYYSVSFGDSLFFVLQRFEDFSIFVYNYCGKLITRINNQGIGEGKYVILDDIVVDDDEGLLVVLDPTGKILRYSIDDDYSFKDEFVFSMHIPAAHNISKITKDEYVLFSHTADNQLFKYSFESDKLNTISYSLPQWLLFSPFMAAQSPFYHFDGRCFYFDQLDGRIYELNDSGLNLRVIWDLGEYHLKQRLLPPNQPSHFYQSFYKKSSYRFATHFTSIQETSNKIYALCTFRNQSTLLIYDKLENKVMPIYRTSEGFRFVPGEIKYDTMYLIMNARQSSQFISDNNKDNASSERYVLLKYYLK